MSVTKRGGKWLARWVIDGRHVARTFDLKDSAVAWEADARRRAQLGAHATAEPSRDTLNVWLKVYWTRESPRWAQSTRITRAQLLDKWIEPYLGGVRLRDLGTARVRERSSDIAGDGCSTGRRNAAHRTLSAALGVATRDGLLPANPCQGIRRAPHTPARPRALTPAEIERIRQADAHRARRPPGRAHGLRGAPAGGGGGAPLVGSRHGRDRRRPGLHLR